MEGSGGIWGSTGRRLNSMLAAPTVACDAFAGTFSLVSAAQCPLLALWGVCHLTHFHHGIIM